jgi:signal transduction histidine kinase
MLQTQTGNQKSETEESLRNSRDLLKQFASHLQTLREEEKVNLSRELHDSLGQSLTGLKIYAHRILKGLNEDLTVEQIHSLREQMIEMILIIDNSLKGVKKIAKEIRPRILDEFGLIPAIEVFIKEFAASRRLRYELIKESRKIELNKTFTLEVYRIIQETISNIICQSNTTLLTVKISEKKDSYVIGIHDDARGLDEKDLFEQNSMRILGLVERVKIFGGNIHISVDPSVGINVVLTIPKNEMK